MLHSHQFSVFFASHSNFTGFSTFHSQQFLDFFLFIFENSRNFSYHSWQLSTFYGPFLTLSDLLRSVQHFPIFLYSSSSIHAFYTLHPTIPNILLFVLANFQYFLLFILVISDIFLFILEILDNFYSFLTIPDILNFILDCSRYFISHSLELPVFYI